ncbi:MAG: anthranilate synthase component I [Bacteroidota bacterium]
MLSFEEFEKLARSHNVIPLTRPLLADTHTPVSIYLTLRQEGSPSFLLESAETNEKLGRYSFVGLSPSMMVRARGQEVSIASHGSRTGTDRNVLEVLRDLSSQFNQAPSGVGTGLSGGFVGYMGYNSVRHLEKIPIPAPAEEDEDDAVFGLFPTIIRFDHLAHIITIIRNVMVDPAWPLRPQYEQGRKDIEALELRLRQPTVSSANFRCEVNGPADTLDKEHYCSAVARAKEHIYEGDIFQVVLSRKIERKYTGDLFPVYRALRLINPSPYLYYIDFGDTKLVGSSPEILVRSRKGIVEVLPIAGTRKRGADEEEDVTLEKELLQDEKELAEHVMLVDLGRNDLGRICKYGTVEVPVLKRVQRYSHVMHIVSEVRGRLKEDTSPVDVLAACFPAGTVSGAPKVRAMEIIHELEQAPRGAYAGAVGYIGFDGSVDTCITIRTLVAQGDRLKIQAGAGIVADSVPETEYQETVNKSRALLEAVSFASGEIPVDQLLARLGGVKE